MPKTHAEPKLGISVNSEKPRNFKEYQWREAIMYFLGEVWAGHYDEKDVVQIEFRLNLDTKLDLDHSVMICFDKERESYQAHGIADRVIPENSWEETLNSFPRSAAEFERALAQFVRNRRYRTLVLPLTDPIHIKSLVFWNKKGRLILGPNIPSCR